MKLAQVSIDAAPQIRRAILAAGGQYRKRYNATPLNLPDAGQYRMRYNAVPRKSNRRWLKSKPLAGVRFQESFPETSWRRDNLSFNHHREVTALPLR